MNSSSLKLMPLCAAALLMPTLEAVDLSVDFTADAGALKRAIHSSGWAPRSYPRYIQNDDEAIRSMNLTAARTHDWALVNSGQRVVDYQYVFPLFDKDAADPSNYFFAPTDYLLSLSRNLGLEIFYRLGTSIEHTGDEVHFNAKVPSDFDKVAEIFAATVRHYNKGWANGKQWNIRYWEIWNEPDGINNMWWLPAAEGGTDHGKMRDKFADLFSRCVKRIKTEFPDVKVGGPALCGYNPGYFKKLFEECAKLGVKPDFISWHYYGSNPDELEQTVWAARKLCDASGLKDCELIINEYHYLLTWDGIHGRNSTPAMVRRALDGPTGHNNIDAAAFYLTMLTRFQTVPLDQAYWYGCAHQGNWGYMDGMKQFNKTYYAARLFGGLLKDCAKLCEVRKAGSYAMLAAKSADGAKSTLLITDYRGTDQLLNVAVKGADNARHVSAVVLDDTRDALPCPVEWRNGRLTLVKPDKNSAAYLITFENK